MSGDHHKSRRPHRVDTATLPLFASAMRQPASTPEQVAVTEQPVFLSTGLRSLDAVLRGGFPVGEATLVAARPRVGATSLLLGGCLAALKRGERVAYFSDSLQERQIKGRFVVLESRVNGYRFKVGFATAEDHIALAAARDRIPWSALSIVARRRILPREVDEHVFSYRPRLVVADVLPHTPGGSTSRKATDVLGITEQLVRIARSRQVAVLVRVTLPAAEHPPNRLELPGVGAMTDAFAAVILLHREEVTDPGAVPGEALGQAEAQVVRVAGHDVEPRVVGLRFDQRFAGLLDE